MHELDARGLANGNEGTKVMSAATPPPWNGLQNLNWFQFSWVSNELNSPKVLVCASDKQKHAAENWGSTDPTGGFRHGKHLHFDPQSPPPLCNLYVSMLQRLGIEVDKFSSGTGTLSGLDPLG